MIYTMLDQLYWQLYEELRELNHEHAPDSFTWLGETLPALAAEANLSEDTLDSLQEFYTEPLGSGEIIGYIYECNGPTLAPVGVDSTPEEVETFLRQCLSLTDE